MIVLPLAIVLVFAIMGIVFSYPPTQDELNRKFIVANPLDLTQIRALSKYRSCAGHDYRGPRVVGKKEATPRSMKHYIKVREDLTGKNGVVKAIAPFDGIISTIEKRDAERQPYDQQVWLSPDADSAIPRQWHFVFFHIDLNDNLVEGSRVQAGQVIGTAYMTRGPEGKTDNFDMAVKFTRPMAVPAIDLPLAHATDDVLAQYNAYGITLDDLVISEEYRDQNTCPTTGESLGGDVYFLPTSDPKDYVYFKQ